MNRLPDNQNKRFASDEQRRRPVPAGAVRVVEDADEPSVALQMLSYFRVDAYGSLWTPGVLTAGISRRLPQLAWGHNWGNVIGRAVPGTYIDNEVGPRMRFYFDDFEADPVARNIYSKVKRGTLDECSIGFGWDYIARDPTDEEYQKYPGVREVMIEVDLDEVSIVLRGAVPDAKVVAGSVRSKQKTLFLTSRSPVMVDREEAARVATELAAGTMDLLTALQFLETTGVPMTDLREGEEKAEASEQSTAAEEEPQEQTTEEPDTEKVDGTEEQEPSEETTTEEQVEEQIDTDALADPAVGTAAHIDPADFTHSPEAIAALHEETTTETAAVEPLEDFSDVDALLAEREIV